MVTGSDQGQEGGRAGGVPCHGMVIWAIAGAGVDACCGCACFFHHVKEVLSPAKASGRKRLLLPFQ
jgi:hypothetical protein